MNHGIRSVKDALQIGSYFAVLTKQACLDGNAGPRQAGKCWKACSASHAMAKPLFS